MKLVGRYLGHIGVTGFMQPSQDFEDGRRSGLCRDNAVVAGVFSLVFAHITAAARVTVNFLLPCHGKRLTVFVWSSRL